MKGDKKIYRLRVADYRVIFEKKDAELVILVIRIGHRKEVYFDI
ncbi:MAG TPA: type II toxin-antitoxin system RelE/ParE family toxin [bacterium]|nr:type II toxin-antitoxin system RelE/ParE family toxin [bacterium]